MKKNWRRALIFQDVSILKSLDILDKNGLQILLVVDSDEVLKGIVTDGDIRRGILSHISLEAPISTVMNISPFCLQEEASLPEVEQKMLEREIYHIPILNKSGKVKNMYVRDDFHSSDTKLRNPVIIMAGGLGKRLKNLTENCPKPMLKIGEKPLLETIILGLKNQGFFHIHICINYLSEHILNYFGNGEKFGVEIQYLKEEKRLGTAGALSLFAPTSDLPILVINGDLLTNINFRNILNFHAAHTADGTMSVRAFDVEVPYGVVEASQGKLTGIKEKPVQSFFVNAGIYVLNASMLPLVPLNEFFDMTDLFQKMINLSKHTYVFPIHEYWLDIGKMDDYLRAQTEASLVIPKFE